MDCAEALQVQAYFDGELEPAAASALEQHLRTCQACQRQLEELQQLRSLFRAEPASPMVSDGLRARIALALEQEQARNDRRPGRAVRPARTGPFWIGVVSGVGGSAVAAALGFLVLAPLLNNPLPGQLVADHSRSLTSSHLIDVVSTDQHTVKPWFASHIDVAPVVADFAPQGYRLLGGRVDMLGRRKAAVVVYQHGHHFINVYSWAVGSTAVPADTTRNGYHMAFWKLGDLGYCAVSDTGWTELNGLVRLLKEHDARDTDQ